MCYSQKNDPLSFNSRKCSSNRRDELAERVEHVSSPSTIFYKDLAGISREHFESGNLKDTPRSKNIYKQVKYESKKKKRLHDNVKESVDLLKKRWIESSASKVIKESDGLRVVLVR